MERGGGGGGQLTFDVLYRTQIVALSTVAAALTGSRETGADLAHEALLRAYRDWPNVSGLDRPGTWLRRVVLNLAADVQRRRRREWRALARVSATAPQPDISAVDDRFWRAVRTLPERQRFAVVLRYVDDMPIDEIASVMAVTAGTVKAALFAARRSLATALSADQEVEHADG